MKQINSQYEDLNRFVNGYIKPNDRKAWLSVTFSIVIQAVAFFFMKHNLMILGWILSTLNMLRLFIIFHDTAHFSFFSSMTMNKIVGKIIGVYVHFPFNMWRDGHNYHHKHFGNLDRVDLSQTILFTKKQY